MEENENTPPQKDRSFISEQDNARLNLERLSEYEQELAGNKKFMEYAAAFSKRSVESFIKDFASRKVRWMEWGNKYGSWKENDDLKWQKRAADMLQEIQQKKLFDLQCRWRAGEINLRGTQICKQFSTWESSIMACPVLTHITDDEAEMYLAYLQSGNYQMLNGMGLWQNYKRIKRAYHNENSYFPYPEWYSFYDSRMGTSAYLLLPDIRGEKERFYISLAEKEIEIKKEIKPATVKKETNPAVTINKPRLDYMKSGFTEWFVKTYESPETYKCFKAMDDATKHNKEENDELVQLLAEAENSIPIRNNKNWKEALAGATAELWRQKCLEVFPAVYDEYKMYRQNNLQGGPDFSMDFITLLNELSEAGERQKILRGRVLNGEPEDFDY